MLGHLRHESGHFYWDRLILGRGRVEAFRAMFGDERADYGPALDAYYAAGGAAAGWQASHVSAYATSHPWEDWAETWAHYLHMVDLLETAVLVQHPPDGAGQPMRTTPRRSRIRSNAVPVISTRWWTSGFR